MKELVRFVRDFFRTENKVGYYVTLLLFLAAAIAINYTFSFETSMRRASWGSPMASVWYFLFYGVPFTYALITYAFWFKRWDLLRSGPLWMAALSALFILSFNGGFTYHLAPIRSALPQQLQYFVLRCSNNIVSALIYGILIGLYWWLVDRRRMPLYGLRSETFNPRPFFLLLLFVAPLIIWASFQPDFLARYPRYTSTEVAQYYGISNMIPTGVYELCYGLDFVSTEFFFRGFMVLALAGVMGRGAVFPMVAVYCFLHFEKPLAEAISSIPGGLFLGIVAYNTRSIYGGIILHLGVAWMMEIAAFLQLAR
jgi:membrane protease YdiL (CAAX protease family)